MHDDRNLVEAGLESALRERVRPPSTPSPHP